MERRALNDAMARLKAGDRAALRPLFDALWPRVRAHARSLVGEHDGDDAAQEALVKLFARASSFDPAGDALAWALAITTWECRTLQQRRRRRREDALEPGVAHVGGSSPEERAVDADLEGRAGLALAALSAPDRETLAIAFAGDLDERPVEGATFRKRRQRALERLRAAFRSMHG